MANQSWAPLQTSRIGGVTAGYMPIKGPAPDPQQLGRLVGREQIRFKDRILPKGWPMPRTPARVTQADIARAIRAMHAAGYPHISIVVASGRVLPGPDGLPEGAHFIGKPFSARIVHRHLQEVLPDEQKSQPLKR